MFPTILNLNVVTAFHQNPVEVFIVLVHDRVVSWCSQKVIFFQNVEQLQLN